MEKKPQNIALFTSELMNLMNKHGYYLLDNLRVCDSKSRKDLDFTTHKCELVDVIEISQGVHVCKDTMGPFIISSVQACPLVAVSGKSKGIKITVVDRDKLLRDGVASPITGEGFTNRAQWGEHLKKHGVVEVGNDLNKAKVREEVRGDFDCRRELTEAVNRVMG